MNKHLFLIAVFLTVFGCKDNDDFGPVYIGQNDDSFDSFTNKMIVGCEGNFQYSNASISVVDLENDNVSRDVYRNVNGNAIGDVLQSFTVKGDTLLVVLNNSGTIKLLDLNSLKEIVSFSGFTSPRHAEFIDDDQIIITDLYAKKLLKFHLKDVAISGSINVSGWQEQIILLDSMAFIANLGQNQIDLINLNSFSLQDSIELMFKPSHLKSMADDRFIAAGAIIEDDQESEIAVFNSISELLFSSRISKSITGFDAKEGDCFYSDSKHVYKYDPVSGLSAMLFPHRCLTPYALHYEDTKNLLVMSDARDYISNGTVQVFNSEGDFLNNYEVGIIPQTIRFTF